MWAREECYAERETSAQKGKHRVSIVTWCVRSEKLTSENESEIAVIRAGETGEIGQQVQCHRKVGEINPDVLGVAR